MCSSDLKDFKLNNEPTLYIGTHAVLNHLEKIKPALLIYDEQHRFGVKQRAIPQTKLGTPHLLTMSATPIPRSLMLTLFSHLELSVIDELPANQQPTTTWLVPKKKREESWRWLGRTLQKTAGQALVVCPFIEPSRHENLSNVTAATELVEELKNYYSKNFPELNLGLLHGRLKETAKDKIIAQTFQQEIDILVTTPVVEVGVDLPAANVMIIEGAERFGLASLHQLRGRVGRAGQESFCLLFTSNSNQQVNQRLKSFTETHDGLKLAEQDLENRGAGDLFGFRQSGISDLRFASWANLELIQTAHQTYQNLKKHDWQPLINYQPSLEQSLPGAN